MAAANARLPASLHAKLPAVLQTSSARSAARASNLIESEESLPSHTMYDRAAIFLCSVPKRIQASKAFTGYRFEAKNGERNGENPYDTSV